jgi:hypothetical protein
VVGGTNVMAVVAAHRVAFEAKLKEIVEKASPTPVC